MEKDIFELIRSLVDFDGDKYSLFEKGKDIIRVNISDGNVIVHALGINPPNSFGFLNTELYNTNVSQTIKQKQNMEYKNLSLDEILAKVDAKYTRQEQNNIAFELVDSLMDSTDDLDEDFDAIAYLAEYFSHGEYREWLCDTFLDDEDEE